MVDVSHPYTQKRKRLSFWKNGTLYLSLTNAQLRQAYYVASRWNLVFLHPTYDASLHGYEMPWTCSEVPGFLRKLPLSNCPCSLHKHNSLAGLNHSHREKDTLRICRTSDPHPNTPLLQSKLLLKYFWRGKQTRRQPCRVFGLKACGCWYEWETH